MSEAGAAAENVIRGPDPRYPRMDDLCTVHLSLVRPGTHVCAVALVGFESREH